MAAPKRKPRTPTVTDLADQIGGSGTADFASENGISEDALVVQIDRNLNERIWAGTDFQDRMLKLTGDFARELGTQVERSLLAQENYEEFEARILKQLGIENLDEPAGWLRNADTQLKNEAKLAWNEAMVSANQQAETVLVWRAVMDEVTTAFCWDANGLTVDEVGELPPHHFGCRCDVITVPDPDSEDPDWAAMGAEILDEMAQEREAGSAQEAEAPSRFVAFRRLSEAGDETTGEGHWVTIHGNPVFLSGPAPEKGGSGGPPTAEQLAKQTSTAAFKRWFGGSKVVDDKGKPLQVFHGTNNPGFETFRVSDSESGRGIFFTDNIFSAEDYAAKEMNLDEEVVGALHDSAGIYGVYLSLQNPAVQEAQGEQWFNLPMRTWIESAKAAGHDGLIIKNIRDAKYSKLMQSTVYVAFDPRQVKSASGNRGTFDPKSPSIRESGARFRPCRTPTRFEAFRHLAESAAPVPEYRSTTTAPSRFAAFREKSV